MSWRIRERNLLSLRTRTNKLAAMGKYAEAAESFEQGYLEALALNDKVQEVHFLNGVGAAHFGLLEYGRAIDALVRARSLARQIGNQKYLTAATANLCNLYIQSGDLASARSAAEEGLTIDSIENLPYRAQLLDTLGLLASVSGDRSSAHRFFLEAVKEAEPNASDRIRLEAWSHYSQDLFHSGDLDGAESAALNAYRIGHLDTVRELRPAYLALARIYRARGNPRLALAIAECGLAIPARRNDRQLWRMYFLYERAMVFTGAGRVTEAAADLRQALTYASDGREAMAPSDSLRSGAEFWLKDVYNAYIDLAARQNAASQAFLAVEEERSASLMQMLRDSVLSGQRERLSGGYREDLARLRALEIEGIVNPHTRDENRAAQVRQRLSEAEAQSAVKFVPAGIKKRETFLSGNTLGDVQRRMGPEEAILSIHLGNTDSYVWGLTRSHIEMHRLPPRDALVTIVRQFNRAVQESAQDRDRIGAKLYADLFGSLSRTILNKRSWILTSDDEMFDVPFAALVVDNKKERRGSSPARNESPLYLVERHETLRIPSALALLAPPAPASDGPFLAVGDGIYNTADNRWTARHSPSYLRFFSSVFGAGSSRTSMELPRLVSSTHELKNCASAWRAGGDSVFLTGPDLSRAKLLPALLLKPAIVHIAAHVLYPYGKPDEALIHLGLGANGAPEVLTTKDISALRADGALVVLSGCSSAAGNSVRGAGVMGLTRAWLLAGASAVVGSRWPVPDDSGDLFRSFYAHLAASNKVRSGLSYALQQAELDMLRSGQWRSDPRYWGAFYLLARE